MKKSLFIFMLALCSYSYAQNYSGGIGTVADPYLIANKTDLKYLSEHSGEWSKHFKQTANIVFAAADFDSTGAFYNGGQGFSPIGNGSGAYFAGSYNGDGHTIDSLYINRPFTDFIGFFGDVFYVGVTIKNLHLRAANVIGKDYTGIFIGNCSAVIENCSANGNVNGEDATGGFCGMKSLPGKITNAYSSGTVSGNQYLGGFCGYSYRDSIANCYSTSSVNGTNEVGGFCGAIDQGKVTNCYATGSVSGVTYTGGFCGRSYSGTISNCFWNIQTSGLLTSNGGTGLNTAQMQTQVTFTDSTWDFIHETANGTADIWKMPMCAGYPRLFWENTPGFSLGSGTLADPYIISTKWDLKTLSENSCLWNKHFKQTANIFFTAADFDSTGAFYNGGAGFIPIGNNSGVYFEGSYNGDGHTIDSLSINRPTQSFIGLFGAIHYNSNVRNLGLKNINMIAQDNIGGLVGYNNGTINNCYSTGVVSGNTSVGRLVGFNGIGAIINCYSIGVVSGQSQTGGLVGINYGNVDSCHSTGTVSGGNFVGGLVGSNVTGPITNCYSLDSVAAISNVGGLVGGNTANITNCHSSGAVSGVYTVGGLVGYSSQGMISQCYSTGATSGTHSTGGLIGYLFSGSIDNCYSRGAASGQYGAGGFCGHNQTGAISNSYSTGLVAGSSSVGGFCGSSVSSITNCFWDTITSGIDTSAGGMGLPTAQMQIQVTFTDSTWDFVGETTNDTNDIWQMGMCSNNGYPVFSWQQAMPRPTISSITNDTTCANNAAVLSATTPNTASIKWYAFADSTAGVSIGMGASYTTAGLSSTTSYWVQADSAGCVSLPKILVTATVNQPTFGSTTQSACGSYTFNGQTLTASGTYYDTLTNAAGCDSVITLQLTIRSYPTHTIKDSICAGDTYLFDNRSLFATGTYTRTVLNGSGCDSIIILNLYVRPALAPTIIQNGFSLSTQSFATYQWKLNGNDISGATRQSLTTNVDGSYTVVVTDEYGCTATSPAFVIVETGVENIPSLSEIAVYPNPFAENVNINTSTNEAFEYSIFDMNGKLIVSAKFNQATTIDLSANASGNYLLIIKDANSNQNQYKLIKQ